MPANSCPSLVRKITTLLGLASLSAVMSYPTVAQMPANSRGNQLSANTMQMQPSSVKAVPSNTLVAQRGLRSIADELTTANNAFSTLSAAIRAAGLTETLARRGPFTVFAPTDEAFRQLPRGTVRELLRPENRAKLTRILTYHVVPENISSLRLRPGSVLRLRTVEGQPLTVRVTRASEIYVNGAKVILADIPASNGKIHGISSVLMP